jgi:histone deacetylase complex regulatory component SIN3
VKIAALWEADTYSSFKEACYTYRQGGHHSDELYARCREKFKSHPDVLRFL